MFKRAFFPLLILAMGGGFFLWSLQSPFWQSLRQVSGIMRLVHREYVDADSVSYATLGEAAIRGIVESLDPYSRYMPAEDFKHFEELTRQRYVGIGVEIERIDERVTVIEAFDEGPAAEAGVKAGDRIVAVDGQDTRDATVVEVSELIRGPIGGEAVIEVHRPSTEEQFTFSLTRRSVELASVVDVQLDPKGIAYLKITQFGERTPGEFRAALSDLEARGMRGLIIDLRNNPGGLLHASKEVASEFFERGELIVYTQGRDPDDREEFRSKSPARPIDYPLVVLINEQSASGAEIVAGALQDTGKAYIVGETSYGKGSVQSVYAFRKGGGLRQTTALYYLPGGESINETGVVPDEIVPISEEEELGLLLQKRHRDYLAEDEFKRLFKRAPDQVDRQLEAARKHLRQLIANGMPNRV